MKNFKKKHTKNVRGKVSLLDNFKNYDCVFLKDKKCLIYEVRPKQCKNFPFWKSNLTDKKSWENLKRECPGIDDENGKFFSSDEIQNILDKTF
ncbi:MAG: hypothetical protein K1060chlam5_00651 [Candidatus Anoxychlamydiales bacterium]|nr:hypothetical protein [Candidatus Anoxychlamydiales bacterium]